jgi:hypothetical protein
LNSIRSTFFLKKKFILPLIKINMDNETQNMNSTQQAPAQGGLPQSMQFAVGSKRSVAARMQHLNFQPFNGNSFSPDSNNEIRINLQAPGFLDVAKHVLRMTVTAVTTTAVGSIDYSLASLFDQIRLESNGTVLERIDRYALIDNVKSQYNDSIAEVMNKSGTSLGPDLITPALIQKGATFGVGGVIGGALTGCIRLRSGLLQSKHGHALPQGSAPIELILRLNPKNSCILGTATGVLTSVTVSNVAFLCPMYQIESEQIMAQYRQVLQSSPLTVCGETYKTYINSLADSGTQQVLQINDRSRSLKSLVSLVRPTGNNAYIFPTNSAFDINNVDRYTYHIAGAQYPPGGVKLSTAAASVEVGEAMDQAQKALAPYNEIRGAGLVGLGTFTAAVSATGGGMGVLAVDLKKFSDSERCMIGMDTASNAQPMTVELQCDSAIGASDVTTFAICEAEWVLAQGRWGVSV